MKLHNPLNKPSWTTALCLASTITAVLFCLVVLAAKFTLALLGILLVFSTFRTIYFIFTGE